MPGIGRFVELLKGDRPVRNLAGRLLWQTGLCRRFTIRKDGYSLRFFPSSVSCAYWIDPDARVEDERVVTRMLDPGGTYVDVGANVGTLAAAAAMKVGPSGRVVAVEANPTIAGFLRENMLLNGFGHVQVHNRAVGSVPGTIRISQRRADDMNFVSAGTDGDGVTVEMTTLDDLAGGLGTIDLLKIDVEGFEKFVLEGAAKTLSVARNVYIELFDENFARYGYGSREILCRLEAAGFTCFVVGQDDVLTEGAPDAALCLNVLATHDASDLERRGFRLPASVRCSGA
ncbi:FkbM family methyltransferase [Skermanella aerolata]|uniref:FkbM family methyltransferase n=1 Tax=Skermanella aerolata TaxID=393310 RepID=UPI003D24F625